MSGINLKVGGKASQFWMQIRPESWFEVLSGAESEMHHFSEQMVAVLI